MKTYVDILDKGVWGGGGCERRTTCVPSARDYFGREEDSTDCLGRYISLGGRFGTLDPVKPCLGKVSVEGEAEEEEEGVASPNTLPLRSGCFKVISLKITI